MDTQLKPQEIFLNTPGKTPFVTELEYQGYSVPKNFYTNGYCLIDNVDSEKQAQLTLEKLISNIDTNTLPIYMPFLDKIRLAKRDEIPVCDDSVETSFQALHFDMGQPMMSMEPQNMFLITGLYIPSSETPKTAKTRVISLKGLFANTKFGTDKEIEQKILAYVKKYGDGWTYPEKVNTYRISCFARIMDAVAGTHDLADYFDKTMAQWFQDPENKDSLHSMALEKDFYLKRGVNLNEIEEDIIIKPGQLLIVDNMRTAHGRIGKRNAKETWQFMYGVHNADSNDIDIFRRELVKLLVSNKQT